MAVAYMARSHIDKNRKVNRMAKTCGLQILNEWAAMANESGRWRLELRNSLYRANHNNEQQQGCHIMDVETAAPKQVRQLIDDAMGALPPGHLKGFTLLVHPRCDELQNTTLKIYVGPRIYRQPSL